MISFNYGLLSKRYFSIDSVLFLSQFMFYITINSLLFPSPLIGERNKTLTIREYLNEIRPYLKDIIDNLQKPKYMENSTRIGN